jgi:CBS domain containing-hemolysin-like protein
MNSHDPAGPQAPGDENQPPELETPKKADRLLDRLKSLVGLRSGSLRSDLAEVLAEDTAVKAEFSPAERTMLQNILALEKRRIGDLMVPRADIVAVQKDIAIGQLLRLFASAAHSRLVVYDDTLDDPTGMVHIRDLVGYLTSRAVVGSDTAAKRNKLLTADLDPRSVNLSEALSVTQIIRPILFVPPSMPAIDLLVKMQATRIHLALVIDEYGGTDGLVSIEDIVEQIVGEIEDEHDGETMTMIVAQNDGSFVADARASLDEAAEKIAPAFAAGEELDDVDTLGGLLVTLAGRVPVRGEIIAGPGEFEIEVLDADPRRAKRLRISRRPPELQRRRRAADDNVPTAPSLPKAAEAARPAGSSSEDDN